MKTAQYQHDGRVITVFAVTEACFLEPSTEGVPHLILLLGNILDSLRVGRCQCSVLVPSVRAEGYSTAVGRLYRPM